MRLFLLGLTGVFSFFLIFIGCIHTQAPVWGKSQKFQGCGVYHKVEKGQTLWKISQVYHIPMNKIISANDIDKNGHIKEGCKLWIPGAKKVLSVPLTCFVNVPPNFIWPLTGTIMRGFGQFGLQRSEGIDIQALVGDPVKAAADGQIIYEGSDLKGYGRVVIIQHGGGYSTVYAHNQENLVTSSDKVKAGQVVARVGQGEESGSAYLHFEIRHHHQALDPISFLP